MFGSTFLMAVCRSGISMPSYVPGMSTQAPCRTSSSTMPWCCKYLLNTTATRYQTIDNAWTYTGGGGQCCWLQVQVRTPAREGSAAGCRCWYVHRQGRAVLLVAGAGTYTAMLIARVDAQVRRGILSANRPLARSFADTFTFACSTSTLALAFKSSVTISVWPLTTAFCNVMQAGKSALE